MATDKPEVVYTTFISTTPEKLWTALTDSEMTKLWWGRHRNVSDWKAGSTWAHQDYDDPATVDIAGTVVESSPPNRLVLTWQGTNEASKKEKPSRVTFEIKPFADVVCLTVTHEEFEPGSQMLQGVKFGWPVVLSSLKTLLETGHALPMTTRRWKGPPT